MTTLATPLDSFPSVVSRAWSWTRRVVWAVAIAAVVIVVVEIWRILDTLAGIHPYVAWAAGVLVGVPLLLWAARSIWRYARVPRATAPPQLPPVEAGWSERDQATFRRYALRWLERQQRNPHLPTTEKDRIPLAIAELARPLTPEDVPDSVAAARALDALGQRWIGEIVAPLDREADRQIRVAAVQVAAATAISPSVLMDSLITLARNLDLIARLADLYYGRPGLVGTVRVARDVLGTAIAAGALEVVTDHVTGAISEMTGSLASRWLGPIGQGSVNGILTMRMGAAAKRRCRSLTSRRPRWSVPTAEEMRKEWRRLFAWIREDLGPAFAGPFARWAKGTEEVERAGDSGDGSESRSGLFGRLFRRKGERLPTWSDAAEGDAAGGTRDDPD